jgi:protein-tyrosine-phosphatase
VRIHQVEMLLEFNNQGVMSAGLEKHDGKNWTEVHTRQIPSYKDTSTKLTAKNLEENQDYDFRAIIQLESGHKLTSNVLTLRTRRSKDELDIALKYYIINAFICTASDISNLLSNQGELLKINEKLTQKIINYCRTLSHEVKIGLVGKVGKSSKPVNSTYVE